MTELILKNLVTIATAIEIAGAISLMIGFIVVTLKCIVQYSRQGLVTAVQNYRQSLARVVLIGLEILVAATIIKTIAIDPTLENMALLAIMVLIRVIIGWTMILEVDGHWPWQKSTKSTERG